MKSKYESTTKFLSYNRDRQKQRGRPLRGWKSKITGIKNKKEKSLRSGEKFYGSEKDSYNIGNQKMDKLLKRSKIKSRFWMAIKN